MIHQSTDAAFLNRVVNHPSVLPYVLCGFKGPLDVTALVENPRNVFLANEFGGFLLIDRDDFVYELHTQFLPEGRGKSVIRAGNEMTTWMFTKTDALRIDTYVQPDNRAAAWAARICGFKKWGTVEINGSACCYYVLTLKDWARRLDLCH